MTESARTVKTPLMLGRYALFDELASGGMATVHLGRLLGPVGFSRTVAIKRLHPQHARDPEFVTMLLDEARLAARIRHPNVVATLDVVATEGEVFLVMEYVEGESLAQVARVLRQSGDRMPPTIAAHIVTGALHGLHAAHEAKGDHGEPLGLVHRDVSPHNILVGTDGIARVLDFGVAKAAGRLQTTDQGRIKGKLSYMAPEQLSGRKVSRKTDVFAAGVVLWEALTGKRLFEGEDPGDIVGKVLNAPIEPPRLFAPDIPSALDAIVTKALTRKPEQRFDTALEMAEAIEAAAGLLPARHVGQWLRRSVGAHLAQRAARVAEIESVSSAIGTGELGSKQRAAARAEVMAVAAKGDPPDSLPEVKLDSNASRSQVSSVVDSDSRSSKRRPARWLPYAVGLATVILPAVFLWNLRLRHSAAGGAGSAAATPLTVTSSRAPQVQPPLATAQHDRGLRRMDQDAGKIPSPLAPSASAPATSASSKPKHIVRRRRVTSKRHHVRHPKPIDTTSLYSRQ